MIDKILSYWILVALVERYKKDKILGARYLFLDPSKIIELASNNYIVYEGSKRYYCGMEIIEVKEKDFLEVA